MVYEPGSIIAGKYRVEHELGHGGMGIVIAAEHVDLRTRVALKFLAQEYAQHAIVVERFLREARACARLRSEHVCRVFDVDRLEDGVPFLVMELLDGIDLSRALQDYGPLDPATASAYVIQACDALVEAHEAGIVHRDLKPANLFLVRRPDLRPLIKVLDFGVAKAQDERDSSITRTETVMGSPNYMAPEQLRSARFADARSDIWSLGVVLAELSSGVKPFVGESTIDLALQIVHQPPRLPPNMLPALQLVVERCLRKDPAERYQRAAELQAALEPIARGMVPVQLPNYPVDTPTQPEPFTATTLGSASGVMHGSRPRSRGLIMGIAAVAALGIGIGAAQLVSHQDEPQAAPKPPAVPAPAPPPVPVAPVPVPVAAAPPPDAAVAPPDAAIDAPPTEIATPRHPPPRHKTKEELGESRK